MMVSDLVDARIEQEKKITLLKTAAKEAGISMTGLKDVYFGNMLTMRGMSIRLSSVKIQTPRY
jgi:hypothetical protein